MTDNEIARYVAERDGWREIACALLKCALDDDSPSFDVPPLEIVDDIRRGKLAGKPIARLAQFWADLTRRESQRRATHGVLSSLLGVNLFPSHDQRDREELIRLFDRLHDGRARLRRYSKEYRGDGEADVTLEIAELD